MSEHTFDFEPPKSWTSTQAVEILTGWVDELARLLEPGRAPLGEAEESYEDEPQGPYGETESRRTSRYAGLEAQVITTGINDGATPDTDSVRVTATFADAETQLVARAHLNSPVHVQPRRGAIIVTAADEDVSRLTTRLQILIAGVVG